MLRTPAGSEQHLVDDESMLASTLSIFSRALVILVQLISWLSTTEMHDT